MQLSNQPTTDKHIDMNKFQHWIDFYAKRTGIKVVFDNKMQAPAAIDLNNLERPTIFLNPYMIKEKFNYKEEEILLDLFHELGHLKEESKMRATSKGREIFEQNKKRLENKGHFREAFLTMQNCFRDFFVDGEIVSPENMPVLFFTLVNLYKEKLFKERNFLEMPTKDKNGNIIAKKPLPKHLQFLYTILREERVKDEKCILDKKVYKIIQRLRRNGSIEKATTGKLEDRLQAMWAIEPIFQKLLEEDIKENQPPEQGESSNGDPSEGDSDNNNSSDDKCEGNCNNNNDNKSNNNNKSDDEPEQNKSGKKQKKVKKKNNSNSNDGDDNKSGSSSDKNEGKDKRDNNESNDDSFDSNGDSSESDETSDDDSSDSNGDSSDSDEMSDNDSSDSNGDSFESDESSDDDSSDSNGDSSDSDESSDDDSSDSNGDSSESDESSDDDSSDSNGDSFESDESSDDDSSDSNGDSSESDESSDDDSSDSNGDSSESDETSDDDSSDSNGDSSESDEMSDDDSSDSNGDSSEGGQNKGATENNNDSPKNPFDDYYNNNKLGEILQDSLKSEDLEQLGEFINNYEEEINRPKTKEELELENRAKIMGIDSNDKYALEKMTKLLKQYDSFLEQLENVKNLETQESVMEEIENLFSKIRSHRLKPRYKAKGPVDIDKGTRLHGPSLATGIADIRAGNINPEMFEEDIKSLKELPLVGKFDLTIVADGSISMAGKKNAHQKISSLLIFEALKRLYDALEEDSYKLKQGIEFNTEGLLFNGLSVDTFKNKSPDFTDKERLDAYSILDYANGDYTNDYDAIKQILEELKQEDDQYLQDILSGKAKKIVLVMTDGESSDSSKLTSYIKNLRELGVMVYGIGITSGGNAVITNYACEDETMGKGEVCDSPENLANVIKNILMPHLENL